MKNRKETIIVISLFIIIMIIFCTVIAFALKSDNKTEVEIGGQNITIANNGDGLYKDEYVEDRYIYRGKDPNNYITFNNEMWRILSVEENGTIKIIRNEIINNMAFDSQDARDGTSIDNFKASCEIKNASESTGILSKQVSELYCEKDISGCNAWSATDNMIGKPTKFKNGNIDGKVSKDSEMLTYLNQEYLSKIKNNHIVNGQWNIGGTSVNNNMEKENISESQFKWNGEIGLIAISDYLKASTEQNCDSITKVNKDYAKCSNKNWLYMSNINWWTITPYNDTTIMLWYIGEAGFIDNNSTINSYGVRPVIYLSSDIKLSGNGTKQQPFTLES